MSEVGQTWREDSAKRAINILESPVRELVNETKAFIKKNKTTGLTTPALKSKANFLIRDLEKRFKRMEEHWDEWSLLLQDDYEATFLVLKAKFEDSREASKEALESLHIIHEDFPKPIPMAGVTNLKANPLVDPARRNYQNRQIQQ